MKSDLNSTNEEENLEFIVEFHLCFSILRTALAALSLSTTFQNYTLYIE